MREKTSVIPEFRNQSVRGRRRILAALAGIDETELAEALDGGIDAEVADKMVENAVGTLGLPFGIALNFSINGADVLVPMAVEEPSVIAAASHAAKRARAGGGFAASVTESLMATQIEIHDVEDPVRALHALNDARTDLLARADVVIPGLVERGGGARDIEVRDLGDGFVVVHVLVDCRDAMGANLLNTVAEALGPRVAEITRGTLGLRILTNYCDRRLARVTARIPVETFGCRAASGSAAAEGVLAASRFAERDPYRAVTHNKGIMNGVDAVVLATGNDFRAVEAAAHAYAARSGKYSPLSTFRLVDDGGVLEAKLEMPLALGTVGGALRAHRGARLSLALSGAKSSGELSMIAAAAGLASNIAALRALATEGIQKGHMALHHRATSPGAEAKGATVAAGGR
jgi:hydroxymethylglutaryl-CoA reductase